MDTLFPLEPILPKGFLYIADFLTLKEEEELIFLISKIELQIFNFHGYEAKRKVASFGYGWSFKNQSLSKGKDIIADFHPLLHKVSNQLSIPQNEFVQLLVTEYPVDSVINWHRDAQPFDLIAGISLMSDCTFRLRPYDKTKQGRASIISIPVRRRSLYVMKGEARSNWEHSTAPVKAIRFSITLRTLKDQANKTTNKNNTISTQGL